MKNAMTYTKKSAPPGGLLTFEDIQQVLASSVESIFKNQRLLVLIPDHTRSLPLPMLFRQLVESLSTARQLDFLVALGTHPRLSNEKLNRLVGITEEERLSLEAGTGLGGDASASAPAPMPAPRLLNHSWDDPSSLTEIGVLTQEQVREIANQYPSTAPYSQHPSLDRDVPVSINKKVFDYDHIIILAPTFPHEVVGFSGGAKYLFPGISGPEMINATHWLGALAGVLKTIGIQDTPVRAMIHAAAEYFPIPITLIAMVVEGDGLSGVFIGDYLEAWQAAADLSSQRHIQWVDRPFRQVLSCAPAMYDELWTAGKAMYKLEPAVAEGGEVIIYAPHLDTVSHVHGKTIYEIGYHCLPYFLQNWERTKHFPLGVVAHSTHVKGDGKMQDGIEIPRVTVTLASKIPADVCASLNLGYRDPASINPLEFANRENEGILYVPKAGEILYRLKD